LELVSQADSAPSAKKEEAEFKVFRPRPLSPRRAAPSEEKHG